ncbi:MAG TPA: gephyrin-like molybdotransferase Glp [Solirubrobacteraceae bacterium]|nr:gephyrin-like molybdotransferase Glp [Solirubrobacteraceae bacterium]
MTTEPTSRAGAGLLEIGAAWELVAAACAQPLPAEAVPLDAAAGRIAAEDARSAVDLPPFDRSAMDGYAVLAADTDPPRALVLAGELAAGDVAASELSPGSAIAITTGAALPEGADTVLRMEDARVDGDRVTPAGPVARGLHVRYRGEDVARGDVLAPAGRELGVHHVTALASAGVGEVAVRRRPVVHVLATGAELLELGAPPEPGRIHESNRLTLRLLAERAGAEVVVHPVVPDDPGATAAAVEAALAGDVLAVSGGVSVGPHDHVKPALQERGVDEVFWRVRLKPGRPLWFGRRDATLVFGLPGNPLSTVACFLLFVGPALRRLQGEAGAAPPFVPARLAVPARPADGRTTLLTARLVRGSDGVLEATPTEGQGSHLTGALAASDGFVAIPHDAGELPAGSRVDALLL